MTLSPKDLDEIQDRLAKAVHESLAVLIKEERKISDEKIRAIIREESCSCPFSECQRQTVPMFFQMVADFGDGDYRAGLLEIRRNHTEVCNIRQIKHEEHHVWIDDVRKNAKKYSGVAVTTGIAMLVAAIVGLVLATIGFEGD